MLDFEVHNRFHDIHVLAMDLARLSSSWDGKNIDASIRVFEGLTTAINAKIQWLKENK